MMEQVNNWKGESLVCLSCEINDLLRPYLKQCGDDDKAEH